MMTKRAWIYLRRKNKRSIILLLLLFIISCSISIGLSVWNNIGDAIKEVEQRMGTSFIMKLPSYSQNPDAGFAVYHEANYAGSGVSYEGPLLDDSVIEQVMKVDGITAYNADKETTAFVEDAEIIKGLHTKALNNRLLDEDEYPPEEIERSRVWSKVTMLYGNIDSSLDARFRTGAYTLLGGRHTNPDDKNVVMISEELAALNDLQVGDTITISLRAAMIGEKETPLVMLGKPWTLEIVGIFRVNGFQPVNDWVSESNMSYNYLFVDMNTYKAFEKDGDDAFFKDYTPWFRYYNVTFFVDDPARLESIVEEVKALNIENGFFDIKIDDTMYKSTTDALRNIRNIVMVLVAVIVAGCGVVLLIVFTMWVRSRRQEISIYLSMGLSKASILGQFVLEAAIIAVLAGTLAFGVCQEVPNTIGNYMLADAIEDAQPDWEEPTREEIHQAAMAGTTHELFRYTNSEYAGPEQIDFAFRFTDFLVLLLLELALITAAICKGGWFIFHMQPRKIMTDLR